MDIIILILATWRLSSLLASEAGPWDAFAKLRGRLGVRTGEDGVPTGDSMIARGIACIWCNSVWIGAVLALIYWLLPCVACYLMLPFTLSAGAIIVNEVIEWAEQARTRS